MVIENVLAQLAYAYSHAGSGHPLPAVLRAGVEARPSGAPALQQASFTSDTRNPNFATERR